MSTEPRVIYDPRPNPPTPRTIQPGCPYPNVFEYIKPLKPFPNRVFIVGSGPNGNAAYGRIPADAFTMALNGMILYPRRWDWWIAFDHRLVSNEWWNTVEPPAGTHRLFGARLVNRLLWPDPDDHPRVIEPHCYFEYLRRPGDKGITEEAFRTPDELLDKKALRGGLNVLGIALQLAVHGGCRDIVLCGCDLFGPGHYDGTVNPDQLYQKTWPWADLTTRYCQYLKQSRGIKFQSMTKTAIGIPQPK